MTEVLHIPSSPSPPPNDGLFSHNQSSILVNNPNTASSVAGDGSFAEGDGDHLQNRYKHRDQLSLLAVLVTVFRKSLVACKTDREELCAMEISWPTNVRHVAHVTFDRFNGFLGLPVEFEPEVPRRAPSASASVFGVSTESMQLSYDTRGNSVPTILLLMQRHLYAQGGLQAEGIFRINAENSQEEHVRDQLNRGMVPEGIDVHCLAGLIKAWFRELPIGILDSLTPEQVMQCESEEDCGDLVRHLPPTEAALLDWAINLMADVVQHENVNKMNARNIAMVFAPNMTQMADPLTALMYAVQVMNFLKTLIIKTLREREDSIIESAANTLPEPSDENGHHSSSQPCADETSSEENEETDQQLFVSKEPLFESSADSNERTITEAEECHSSLTSTDETQDEELKRIIGQSSNSQLKKGSRKINRQQSTFVVVGSIQKAKEISNLSRINSRTERIEAWR